jgi:hypothetical protein
LLTTARCCRLHLHPHAAHPSSHLLLHCCRHCCLLRCCLRVHRPLLLHHLHACAVSLLCLLCNMLLLWLLLYGGR